MPFTEESQIAANTLKNDITLDKVFYDIQKADDIELYEQALSEGKRALPVGKKSPFMILGPFPSPFDIDEYYTDPIMAKSVQDICNYVGLNKEDLYLTYAVKYPKEPESEHPMIKDGKRHMKRFFFKELLTVQPDIIFAVGKYTKSLIEKTFRISLEKGLNSYILPLRINGKQLEYKTKIMAFENASDLEVVKDEVEKIKIDWKYVHLHTHNTLSFRDGIGTPDTRIQWHIDKQKPAIATSNHGNICDWITMYNGAKNNGMKPILGMEAYINRNAQDFRNSINDDSPASKAMRKVYSKQNRHITLFAKNYTGFKNIVKIHNDGWVNGFYRFPICDPEYIKKNSEGIVVLSGCGSGEQNRILLEKVYLESEKRVYDKKILIENKIKAMKSFFKTKNDDKFADNEYLDQKDFEYFYLHQEEKFNEDEYTKFITDLIEKSDKEQIEQAPKRAREIIKWWNDTIDNYYIELMVIDWEPQKIINQELIKIAQEMDIPVVITNDAHYLNKAESKIQELQMLADQDKTFKQLEEDTEGKIWTIHGREFYYKNVEELHEAWEQWHKSEIFTEEIFWQGIHNTIGVVDIIEDYDIDKTEKLPKLYDNGIEVLVNKCLKGMKERGFDNNNEYQERLKFELGVITKKGYTDYFLIMDDIMNWTKDKYGEASCGSGRGSAAGSLVNYLLHITEVDPIKYNLLFERFLDIERYDMPDIDSDFQTRLRDKVINHIIDKYGRDNVANIGTFGMLKIKSAIQDVARVCDIPPSEVFAITKKIPQDVNDTSSLEELEQNVPALRSFLDKYDNEKTPIRWYINGIRGAHRQPGSHASGVLISSHSLMDNVAIIQSKKNIISGWVEGGAGHELSDIGYAKFDILGLNNLQVVDDAISLIEKRHNKKLSLDFINSQQEDQNIYKNLVKAGDHYGIFQMESNTAARVCKQVDPDNFTELCDISALIRPGTLMMGIPEMYSDRKFGRHDENDHVWSIEDVPVSIRPIMKDTYGLMIYQEQLMKIAEYGAKFTKAETNMLRRLIVKFGKLGIDDPKFVKNIKYYYDKFIINASLPIEEGGLGGKLEAQEMWDLMVAFAGYSFNLSHSISYTFLTFQEYWLKAYYRPEFNVALLNNTSKGSKKKGESKISIYVTEIMGHGMEITPPNVNTSNVNFDLLNDTTIAWGLSFIKTLPDNTIIKILQERKKSGKFKNIEDFYNRITDNGKKKTLLNKRAIDALTWSGAFDDFVDEGGFEDRFDIHAYIFTELRKEKKYEGEKSTYKLIVDRETEYCNLSLTEMESFVDMRKQLSTATGKEVNYIHEIDEAGNYYVIGKVEKTEIKKTKTGKDYVRITLKDETKSKPFIYCWPWKNSQDIFKLRKGNVIAGRIENDGNFVNLVGHKETNVISF